MSYYDITISCFNLAIRQWWTKMRHSALNGPHQMIICHPPDVVKIIKSFNWWGLSWLDIDWAEELWHLNSIHLEVRCEGELGYPWNTYNLSVSSGLLFFGMAKALEIHMTWTPASTGLHRLLWTWLFRITCNFQEVDLLLGRPVCLGGGYHPSTWVWSLVWWLSRQWCSSSLYPVMWRSRRPPFLPSTAGWDWVQGSILPQQVALALTIWGRFPLLLFPRSFRLGPPPLNLLRSWCLWWSTWPVLTRHWNSLLCCGLICAAATLWLFVTCFIGWNMYRGSGCSLVLWLTQSNECSLHIAFLYVLESLTLLPWLCQVDLPSWVSSWGEYALLASPGFCEWIDFHSFEHCEGPSLAKGLRPGCCWLSCAFPPRVQVGGHIVS